MDDEFTPHDRKILSKLLSVAEDNNAMLRNLQSAMRWSRFFRIAYWVVIIGVAVGAFYFLQPFIDRIRDTFGLAQSGIQGVERVGDRLPDLKGLLQQ